MTVQEVILTAATELGFKDDIAKFFAGEDASEATKKKAELLLDCFNLVENEVALDYLPLYAEDDVYTETGAVLYETLSRSVVRVLRVADEWGNPAQFTLFPDRLQAQPGKLKIAYTYTPEKKEIFDESDFRAQVSTRLLAYGVATEYTLATGLYEESAVWDKKYKDAIAAAYHARPSVRMRSRRWA